MHLQQPSNTVRPQSHGSYRCLFQIYNNLLTLSVGDHSLVANANPEVVSTYKSVNSHQGRPEGSFAAKHGGSLTPHLIYPKKLSLVLAVVKQVPEVHIVKKHTVYQLLSASPVMSAQHIRDCTRDVFSERVHLHAAPKEAFYFRWWYSCPLGNSSLMRNSM